MSAGSATTLNGIATVVFDIDGTLLDSATGILAGFRRALAAGGVDAPTEAELRVHLGPPLQDFLLGAGVTQERLAGSIQAYRDFYLAEGMWQAAPYEGIVSQLDRLVAAGYRLATASAKRQPIAEAIVTAHGLAPYFEVIGGTDHSRLTKAQTLAYVSAQLGADPAETVMIGDRHHDIEGAHACGIRAVGVRWGYGVDDELARAGADWLLDEVTELGRLLGV
ncbi:MAG: HAD-IA family hydrolase [Microlunatus sp.]